MALELRRRGASVPVQGQPLRILAILVRHAGDLVTRDALRDALWPDGTFVDFEHGLNAAVRRLRRALEDEANTPRFIETLARRGYRFVAPIDRRSIGSEAASIAVLPFSDTTGDPDTAYLPDGITDRLIAELAVLGDLRVIARSAALRHTQDRTDPRTAGRRLGVGAVVAGAISRRVDASLSIHVELLDVASGRQLWAACYDRREDDLPGVEQELAASIYAALKLPVTSPNRSRLQKRATPDPIAHREYLKGRHFLTRMDEAGVRRAIDHFKAAAAADRRYGLAYCALAECYNLFAFLGLEAPDVALPKAREAARTALAIDEQLAEAHATLASVTKVYDWDWPRAEQGYRRALAISPSYAAAHRWYAAHLAAMGRRSESLAMVQRASELDPVSPLLITELAWNAYMAREFDIARWHSLDALDLQPAFQPALFTLGLACEQLQAYDDALMAFRGAGAAAPNPAVIASEAHLLARMGRQDIAAMRWAQLEECARQRYVPPYWFGIVAAGLGDREEALTSLECAVERHDVWLVWSKTEPRLDGLRDEYRFQRVLNRIGLGDGRVSLPVARAPEAPARLRVVGSRR